MSLVAKDSPSAILAAPARGQEGREKCFGSGVERKVGAGVMPCVEQQGSSAILGLSLHEKLETIESGLVSHTWSVTERAKVA